MLSLHISNTVLDGLILGKDAVHVSIPVVLVLTRARVILAEELSRPKAP